jgi:hypothetical protein
LVRNENSRNEKSASNNKVKKYNPFNSNAQQQEIGQKFSVPENSKVLNKKYHPP